MGPQESRLTLIPSKFASTCSECSTPISVGELIGTSNDIREELLHVEGRRSAWVCGSCAQALHSALTGVIHSFPAP